MATKRRKGGGRLESEFVKGALKQLSHMLEAPVAAATRRPATSASPPLKSAEFVNRRHALLSEFSSSSRRRLRAAARVSGT
eukprot:5008680-Pyramimonas_sp.AAC.1